MKTQDFSQLLRESVDQWFWEKFRQKIPSVEFSAPPPLIDAEFTIPCFQFASVLKKSPAVIANELAESIRFPDFVLAAVPSGPYLNVKLRSEILFGVLIRQILEEQHRFGWSQSQQPRTILVEYSSPNTNKPLHLGHIRNNVLGMSIVRLLESQGDHIIPATILNDRGIHICKAMVAYSKFGTGQTPDDTARKVDHFVGEYYVLFEKKLAEDPSLLEEARAMLRAWETGDPETRSLWKRMNEWVYSGFEETYRRMGSEFELKQFESETFELGRQIALSGLEKEVFFRREDGSIWVDLTDIGLDQKAIIRGDGTTLYLTQDLGVAAERFKSINPDKVIYVVGSEQIYHFQVLFEILNRLGYAWKDRCLHLSYGMVYLPEGKMKSREGKVVDADHLMDEMKQMALDVMKESHLTIDPTDQDSIAEDIGLGAIKYFILKVNPQKDIHFDPAASLSFDGMTGAYLQYTFARIQSILRKSGYDNIIECSHMESLKNTEELALGRILLRYPDVVRSSAQELNPSRLAVYLYDFARQFNVFYTNHRVLDAESESLVRSRLALCAAVSHVLKNGLSLLGITAVQRM